MQNRLTFFYGKPIMETVQKMLCQVRAVRREEGIR